MKMRSPTETKETHVVRMTKALRDRWVAALRSGEYVQGRGKLVARRSGLPDEYCCLGVLGDLLAADGVARWIRDPEETNPNANCLLYSDTHDPNILPDALARDLGFLDGSTRDTMRHLAYLNDTGYSFARIADEIERVVTVHDDEEMPA